MLIGNVVNQRVSDTIHRTRLYLGDHPFLRWVVVPLLFMATIVLVLAVLLPRVTPFGTVQLVGGYLVLSGAAIVVGLVIERVLIAALGGKRA